jgi:uncharacterized membrane protein YwaF
MLRKIGSFVLVLAVFALFVVSPAIAERIADALGVWLFVIVLGAVVWVIVWLGRAAKGTHPPF